MGFLEAAIGIVTALAAATSATAGVYLATKEDPEVGTKQSSGFGEMSGQGDRGRAAELMLKERKRPTTSGSSIGVGTTGFVGTDLDPYLKTKAALGMNPSYGWGK